MKGTQGLSSMVFTVVVGLFILGLTLPCFSQPPREGRPAGADSRPGFGGDEPPPPVEKREEIRKRIELIRMWKLTEELDLTEETGSKLFPILRKYDEKWIKLQRERQKTMKQLRKALSDEAASDEEIEEGIDKVERNALGTSDLIRQQREELKGVLSPRQQATFILFQRGFQREIREIMAEARQRKVKARQDDRLKRD
jgi:Spy/CpxP family protein refolding chaperone